MTNKPMLSVERELLEELRNVCGKRSYREVVPPMKAQLPAYCWCLLALAQLIF